MWAFAGLYSAAERAQVTVVTMDCHAPYRYIVRLAFPNALIVADAFHLHRQANYAAPPRCAAPRGTGSGELRARRPAR